MKKILAMIISLVLLLSASASCAEKEAQGSWKIINMKKPPALVTERALSDEEIAGMVQDDLDTLKENIRTYGDFIAWVRTALFVRKEFYGQSTSNGDDQFTFGARFSFSWLESWFSPNMTVSIAQYVLEDDYPGIGTVCVILKSGAGLDMKCANYVPMDGGYYVLNPEWFIGADGNTLRDSCVLQDMLFVTDLQEIMTWFGQIDSRQVVQILALESADTVVLDNDGFRYVPQDTTYVAAVYYDETAKYPPKGAKLAFKQYGFPKQLNTGSEIDAETARKLEKGTFEEAAAAIGTIPDVLNYLFYTGFTVFGRDELVEMHDGIWHYNLKPNVVFIRGKGDCGAVSGLIAALLEGDYEEVGMINLRFPYDGHVINYIKDGSLYYVFDGLGWVTDKESRFGLSFCYGETLNEAAGKYAKQNDTRMMTAYINHKGGDCPIIFDEHASRMPANYCDSIQILQETPEEGFTITLVETDPEIMHAIDAVRGVW